MSAIFRREFRTYFTSPLGYVVLAMMFALCGALFASNTLYGSSADLSPVFSSVMLIATIIVLPVLTMRLMSEDKRQRTDQMLLTAPVSLTSIVLGKFFAALLLLFIGTLSMVIFAFIIALQTSPDWMVFLGNYIGLLFLGSLIIAIGLFVSSLTESQFIAALGTFLVSFFLLTIETIGSMITSAEWMTKLTGFLSVYTRYTTFTTGLMQYDDVFFFVSMTALFLFLSVRVLDRKRWN